MNVNTGQVATCPSYTIGSTTSSNVYAIPALNPVLNNDMVISNTSGKRISITELEDRVTAIEARLLLISKCTNTENIEALKIAYDNYKLIESLCTSEPKGK